METTVAIVPKSDDDLVKRLMAKARSFAVVSEDGESVTYADGAILVEAAEEIARLRGQVSKWQPIETAPKDGTPIRTIQSEEKDHAE
jgi:hypothetical protein